MSVTTHLVGAFQENCYLVVDDAASRAVLIDPGAEPDRLVAAVRASGAELDAIWLTHAHVDHVGGIAGVKRVWDVPIFLHPADRPLYLNADRQAAAYGLPFEAPPPYERELADEDTLRLGALAFQVMHTPGHSPGHCIFVGPEVAFVGDLIFAGAVGRTDLPLSDPRQMRASLERAAGLAPSLRLHPGHGPETTLAVELRSNAFLTGAARVVSR